MRECTEPPSSASRTFAQPSAPLLSAVGRSPAATPTSWRIYLIAGLGDLAGTGLADAGDRLAHGFEERLHASQVAASPPTMMGRRARQSRPARCPKRHR